MKIGQTLSERPDLIGASIADHVDRFDRMARVIASGVRFEVMRQQRN